MMEPGTLYIVATPIGNLADLTLRAAEVLESVEVVAAEDTRRTRKLLTHLGIGKRLISYREENSVKAAQEVLKYLRGGQSAALVTDAGTPGISDPGHHLVQKALESDIDVVPVPGPSAVAAALSVSGLPLDRFVFEGFLPPRRSPRRKRILELARMGYPVIIYESPRRVSDTLSDIMDVLGERNVVVAREMTKIHEEFLRGPVSEIIRTLQGKDLKGEVTLVIEGGKVPSVPVDMERAVKAIREEGLSAKSTASILADLTGISKQSIYRMAIHVEPGTEGRGDPEKRRKRDKGKREHGKRGKG